MPILYFELSFSIPSLNRRQAMVSGIKTRNIVTYWSTTVDDETCLAIYRRPLLLPLDTTGSSSRDGGVAFLQMTYCTAVRVPGTCTVNCTVIPGCMMFDLHLLSYCTASREFGHMTSQLTTRQSRSTS
jgi:hypothetical protein